MSTALIALPCDSIRRNNVKVLTAWILLISILAAVATRIAMKAEMWSIPQASKLIASVYFAYDPESGDVAIVNQNPQDTFLDQYRSPRRIIGRCNLNIVARQSFLSTKYVYTWDVHSNNQSIIEPNVQNDIINSAMYLMNLSIARHIEYVLRDSDTIIIKNWHVSFLDLVLMLNASTIGLYLTVRKIRWPEAKFHED